MRSLLAVVFDLDDTLYPEQEFVRGGLQAVATWAEEHLGISRGAALEELWRLFLSGVRGNTFDVWLRQRKIVTSGIVDELVRVYRQHSPTIRLFPGTAAVLARLRCNYRVGLLTDGYGAVQRRKVAALGIEPFFTHMVFSDELGGKRTYWKPSRVPYETILELLGVDGYASAYVGDNPLKDFLGARGVGMRTVRIRHPDGLYSHVEPPTTEHAPDIEIGTIEELEEVLCLLPVRTVGG